MPMHRIGSFHFSLTCYSLSLLFICPSLSFKTFGMFLAPPVLDRSCIRTLDLHLACSLHLLCWILFVFVHWIFDCFVSVAILVINIHASWILDLLCWVLFVFFHWIFECSVSVTILVINIHASWILDILCWILFVFSHWIFECSVSVTMLVIKQSNHAVD